VAEELRRVREGVRDRALLSPPAALELPESRATLLPERVAPPAEPAAPPPALRPDNTPLNSLWQIRREGSGLRARIARFLRKLCGFSAEAQESFNSRQVQFDNELLTYFEARLAQTHAQYDAVLGIHRRHMAEIDERHLILQEELVAHVHDLVRRIDLVLAEGEKGRLSLEFALRDLRARLQRTLERAERG
jgi:hypothetical protein